MRNTMGTPSTLLKAIKNGMYLAAQNNQPMPQEIERHIKDYINQMLTVLMISEEPKEVTAAEKLQKLLFERKEAA